MSSTTAVVFAPFAPSTSPTFRGIDRTYNRRFDEGFETRFNGRFAGAFDGSFDGSVDKVGGKRAKDPRAATAADTCLYTTEIIGVGSLSETHRDDARGGVEQPRVPTVTTAF